MATTNALFRSSELFARIFEHAGQQGTLMWASIGVVSLRMVESYSEQRLQAIEQVHRTDVSFCMRLGVAFAERVYTWSPSSLSCRTMAMQAERCHLYALPSGNRGCLALARSGNTLFSGGFDGVIRCWDVTARKVTKQLEVHGAVGNLAVFGDWLVSCSPDLDDIRVWDVPSGTCRHILSIHPLNVVLCND